MPVFGEILAELRQDKGMSQKDLADKLHVAKSSISNYETGQRRAHTELIYNAAKVFHVSTDYLLGLSDYREPFSITRKKYSNEKTVGDVLEQMLSLDSERRHLLCMLLDDLQLGAIGTKESESNSK